MITKKAGGFYLQSYCRRLIKTVRPFGLRLEKFITNPFVHPVIFSIYPILFIYSFNITELLPNLILLPVVLSISTAAVMFFLVYIIIKNSYQATLITSVLLILFFSYAHLYQLIVGILKIRATGYQVLGVCILLLVLSIVIVRKQYRSVQIFTRFLNIVSITLLTIVLVNILSYETQFLNLPALSVKQTENNALQKADGKPLKRDIYYIILDAYGREDVLSKNYDYDNTDFLDYLKDKGFYVATKSTSNYAYTHLSLPSTFNLTYLDHLVNQYGTERKIIDPILNKMFHENEAVTLLKSEGYQIINFDSGWWFTQDIPTANINIRVVKSFSLFGKDISINDFYLVLLDTTALSPFTKRGVSNKKRDRILYNFDKITEFPYMRGNKFVLAHFVIPHPPYLFDENGNLPPEDSPSGFDKVLDIKQLRFTNKLVISMVDKLLARSDPQPIIIIASDHGPLIPMLHAGPGMPTKEMAWERMSILNAYYFPDGGNSKLYDTITPVNSFRILFNYYFGTNYEILKDRNYFSWTNALNVFYDVTDLVKGNQSY